jgi:flagellar protein FliS
MQPQLQLQQNKYLETAVQTASPAQLLIMLHDGAIRFGKKAIEAIQSRQYEEANDNLLRVQNIISELIITLDRSSPIAETLLRLYEYFQHLLIQANIKKSVEPIQETLGYIAELKETWVQAARSQAASAAGAAGAALTSPSTAANMNRPAGAATGIAGGAAAYGVRTYG